MWNTMWPVFLSRLNGVPHGRILRRLDVSAKSAMTFGNFLVFVFLVLLFVHPILAKVPMISFLSDRSGDTEVFLVYNDGQVEKLTKHKARTVDPTWSPDGKTLIYTTNVRKGELFDLFTMNIETKKHTDLTKGGFGNNLQKPRWAPKGDARIIIESPGIAGGDNWDIGVLDLTRKPLALLNVTNAEKEGKGQDQEGSWSPDGTMIAFQSERLGNFDIFIADMGAKNIGGNQRRVTKHAAGDLNPRWSPDGTKILFESKRDGDVEIFVIDIDGNNLKQLTNNDATDRNADWVKNGIVFESKRDGNFEIYRMNPDGSNQINLTNDPGNDGKPLWSPNGKKILFSTRRDDDHDWRKNRELYIMNADGSNMKNLTNHKAKDTFGRWNPIYFLYSVEPQQKQLTTLGKVKRTSLLQNYPNPFNPETWMPYYLAEEAFVTVRIYNIKGALVRSFDIGKQPAGAYMTQEKAVNWNGRNNLNQFVSSGTYFYELLADKSSRTRRMVLMK